MTPERIAELRRLLTEATPEPWFAHVDDDGPCCESVVYVGTDRLGGDLESYPAKNGAVVAVLLLQSGGVTVNHEGQRWDENARLIAETRNSLPGLLDALEAAQAELAARTTELAERTADRDRATTQAERAVEQTEAVREELARLEDLARAALDTLDGADCMTDGGAAVLALREHMAAYPAAPEPDVLETFASIREELAASGTPIRASDWLVRCDDCDADPCSCAKSLPSTSAPCGPCHGLGRVVAPHPDLGSLTLSTCGACRGEGTVSRG